jgi:glutaredoxin
MTSFPRPDALGYTLFSKHACVLCDKMKTVLLARNIPFTLAQCDDLLQGDTREPFIEHLKTLSNQAKIMFPLVFHNGCYIGGFADARKYVEDEAEEW